MAADTDDTGETVCVLVHLFERGYAAHLPDASGYPLCKGTLKLISWQIQECKRSTIVICHFCKGAQAKLDRF